MTELQLFTTISDWLQSKNHDFFFLPLLTRPKSALIPIFQFSLLGVSFCIHLVHPMHPLLPHIPSLPLSWLSTLLFPPSLLFLLRPLCLLHPYPFSVLALS